MSKAFYSDTSKFWQNIKTLKSSGKALKSLRNQVFYQLQLGVPQDLKKLQCFKKQVCNKQNKRLCFSLQEISFSSIITTSSKIS